MAENDTVLSKFIFLFIQIKIKHWKLKSVISNAKSDNINNVQYEKRFHLTVLINWIIGVFKDLR